MTTDMTLTGWGDPARRTGLPAHAATWLAKEVGPGRPSAPAPVTATPGRLPDDVRAALAAAVGATHVATDDATRLLHAAGKSYLDLLRLRAGGEVAAPDAVVLPGTAEEVATVLRLCAQHAVAVVPFGGGTSVVGGVSPLRGRFAAVVALDLRRLDRLLSVDQDSLTAVFQPGLRGPAAERLLQAHGLTLGHFPQSYEHASIGGYAATRSAGQASSGYGRFDDLVVSLVVQTPAGELRLGRGAASAAGPDLRALVVGSEGAFGVITEVELKVRRRPETQRFEGAFFRSWAEGTAALRELEQTGLAPDVLRLSDPDETRVQLALAGTGGLKGRAGRLFLRTRGYGQGCLAVLGWDGPADEVARRRSAALGVVRRHGGQAVGASVGERWAHGRFEGPYLRDDLLDAGVLVETLETSATWSRLAQTWDAVRAALTDSLSGSGTGPGPVVMCHVSHVYPHGASLYFTVLARQSDTDPVGQWQRAKDDACAAIVATGATITHHHAVGTDHRAHLVDEVGALGVEVLRAVKAVLDPAGVLNPGKLLPEA
ncbi:MAG: FAD-binding oxidoreductase [Mycobacteriales bacterium]|nr:FAD-binding oxidoreductase [Mycobacteriales bacterium]